MKKAKNVTKRELVAEVSRRAHITNYDVDVVISVLSTVIEDICERGDYVRIPYLGKFSQKINKAHKAINPVTKEPMFVKESRTIKFKQNPSKKIIIEPTEKDQ